MNTFKALLNIYILKMSIHYSMHCVNKHTQRATVIRKYKTFPVIQESKVQLDFQNTVIFIIIETLLIYYVAYFWAEDYQYLT